MERKLLSLPSFFVLLLIAGIAFLAVPVENVDAASLPANSVTVAEDGSNVVYTFKFDGPIKGITGTGTTALTAAQGFGPEDLVITREYTKPDSAATADPVTLDRAGEFTIAALSASLATVPAANQHFTVTVPKGLANSNGTITLNLADSPEADDASDVDLTAWTGHADIADGADGLDQSWTDHDGDAPTVTFAEAVGTTSFTAATTGNNAADAMYTVTGTDVFQIKIKFNEALGTGTAGFTKGDVAIATMPALEAEEGEDPPEDTRSAATAVWEAGDSTKTAPKYIVVITPDAAATSLEITVEKDAVADANGNKSVATMATVTVNRRPEVTITGPAAKPSTGNISVKFEITSAEGQLAEDEITVSNGALMAGSLERDLMTAPTATVKALYTAIVTPTYTANVVITVKANAVGTDALGNMAKSETIEVTVPDTDTSEPTEEVTGVGDPLTGKNGFSFTVDLSTPNATNSNRHLVLAKSPGDAGFTPGAGNFNLTGTDLNPPNPMPMDATRIDIRDDLWVDLRHFLVTREGGTIDLIKQGNSAPVKSLVISEVMWGYDRGLDAESNSQWIELYNTTNDSISGTWELVFTAKNRGGKMPTGDDAKVTTAASLGGLTSATSPVVDKLSTWRDVGSYWDWRISDSTGGSHGQSGKSTPNSATSVGNRLELVSMQRKINYDNVTKKHKDNAVENRTEQLKAVPGGVAAGNWEATPEHGEMLNWRRGTPGAAPTIKKVDKSGVARSSVVFNEIANRTKDNEKYEWIELYNKGGSDQKINDWMLSVVTATGTDTELITFTSGTNGDDIVVPAGGYLLVVNTDPDGTTLEGGYNVADPTRSKRRTADGTAGNPARLYYVSNKLVIPDKDFLLILRNGKDKRETHEKIQDIAGHNPRFVDDAKSTQVWPLNSWNVGDLNDLSAKDDKTWVRDQGKDVFHGDAWKDGGGFTGLGIARNAGTGSFTSGTPGYANNAVQTEVKSDGLTHANPVVISEIMVGTNNGRSPQWIELHNPSHTQAVNLKGWKLEIFNYYDDEDLEVDNYAALILPEVRIQPNQTVLIVSVSSNNNAGSKFYPDNRIINIFSTPELKKELNMQSRRDAILSSIGFYLKLSDPKRKVVDEVGNIDGSKNAEPDWTLPGGDDDAEGRRSSMVRVENSENDGMERDSWRDAAMVDSVHDESDELYYGDDDDVGTPGYKPGGVLPVQLSSFYSKRNDTGAVVITWSTESELDNAGFNILRSQSRTGEFVRINAQLIPGAGTTGEKSAYTWTDTSAKPNVLYFYQIEDVSLAGDHRTLRTTRLRGYIGAAGKATTTWGDLKSRE